MSLFTSSRHLVLKLCHHNLRHLKPTNSTGLNKYFSKISRNISKQSKSGGGIPIFTIRNVPLIGGGVALGIAIGYGSIVSDSKHWFPVVQADSSASQKVIHSLTKDGSQDGVAKKGDQVEDDPTAEGGKLCDKKHQFDWNQLLQIIGPYWKRLLWAVGSAFAVAAINVDIPSVLGQLVDVVTRQLMETGGNIPVEAQIEFLNRLKGPALKLILLYMGQAVGTFSYIYNLSVVGERLAMELRTRLFASLLNQEVAFYDSHMTGELVSRLTADIQDFKSSFKQCLSQGLRSFSQLLGCIGSLYFVSKEMTLTVLGVVPAIIFLGTLFARGLRGISRQAQMQLSESSGHAEETLSNIRTVKAFAMEEQELLKYKSEIEQVRKLNIGLSVGIGLFQAGSNLFLNGIVLGVMYTGGALIAAERISSGDLMSFLVASQTIQKSLANMSLLFGQFVRGLEAGARVFNYINLNPSGPGQVRVIKKTKPSDLMGDIEFNNVTFSYPSRPDNTVLRDLSLKIPRAKMVAVVGASGSGKSTLANIIEGFYHPQEGTVTIDGQNVEDLETKWLRGEAIGLINQEPVLFATTIMENIRYGKPNATDAEVFEAARKANAYDFIVNFPEGFNTPLGERGVTVSGGQRQRLAIARALIKSPKILILDEATSALDAESERVVQQALDSAVQGRTVLVIAHRLSTVKNADVIAVMSHGQIVEMGTHDNLMTKQGFYYNLVKQQEFQKKQQ